MTEPLVGTIPDPHLWMCIYDKGTHFAVYVCKPTNNDYDFMIHGEYKIHNGVTRLSGDLYLKSYLDPKKKHGKEILYNPAFAGSHSINREAIYTKKHIAWFWGKLILQQGGMHISNVRYVENKRVFRVIYSPNCTIINDKLPADQQ